MPGIVTTARLTPELVAVMSMVPATPSFTKLTIQRVPSSAWLGVVLVIAGLEVLLEEEAGDVDRGRDLDRGFGETR